MQKFEQNMMNQGVIPQMANLNVATQVNLGPGSHIGFTEQFESNNQENPLVFQVGMIAQVVQIAQDTGNLLVEIIHPVPMSNNHQWIKTDDFFRIFPVAPHSPAQAGFVAIPPFMPNMMFSQLGTVNPFIPQAVNTTKTHFKPHYIMSNNMPQPIDVVLPVYPEEEQENGYIQNEEAQMNETREEQAGLFHIPSGEYILLDDVPTFTALGESMEKKKLVPLISTYIRELFDERCAVGGFRDCWRLKVKNKGALIKIFGLMKFFEDSSEVQVSKVSPVASWKKCNDGRSQIRGMILYVAFEGAPASVVQRLFDEYNQNNKVPLRGNGQMEVPFREITFMEDN